MGDSFLLLLLLVVLLSKSCSDCIQGIVPALVALLLPAQAVAGRSKSTVFITSLKDLLKHGGGCLTLRYVLIDRCKSAVFLFASDVMSEDSRFCLISMSIPGWGYMLVQPLLLDAKDE